MSDDHPKKRLGRGLAALIGDMDEPAVARPAQMRTADRKMRTADRKMPIEFVTRNPQNPRSVFDDDDLKELAQSLSVHGMVQPILVRTLSAERYEIIAGERRWRAAQMAGLLEVPVLIRDVDDRTALEIAIVENVQRSDLNPLDEAQGYEQLIAGHGYTQNDLGEIVGKSRSHIANTLRLLKLPEPVRDMVAAGVLSAGHARAIAATSDPVRLAGKIVENGMSVREAERLAQRDLKEAAGETGEKQPKREKDADTLALERTLSDAIGLKVLVNHSTKGGQLKIEYRTLEQLETVCRLLGAEH